MKRKASLDLMGNWVILVILFAFAAVILLFYSSTIISEIAKQACNWGNQFIQFFDTLLGQGITPMDCNFG
ncbi:MAG: hypothetical protein KAI53_00065 [Candidatus Aenigmarchaeota archaeon]|nr:hypothetical protein [Candidatus Aenigmarchaeota archaeon]